MRQVIFEQFYQQMQIEMLKFDTTNSTATKAFAWSISAPIREPLNLELHSFIFMGDHLAIYELLNK